MIEKTFPITEKILNNGLAASQRLLTLLKAEAENLERRTDPQTLSHIALQKKEAVVQLEQFSTQISQVLATEKLLVSQDGFKNYLIKAKGVGFNIQQCWRNWRDIAKLSENCRTLNEQNGASIELLSRHTHRSLNILRGKSQLNTTYGPDGSPRSQLFSHTLVSV